MQSIQPIMYMAYPQLQDGQDILKWNCQSCLGQYLGFSDTHSSLVTNVHHLSTGYVLSFVFDDLFETVFSTGNDYLLVDICNHLFDFHCNVYFYNDEFISDDHLVYYPPSLDEVWLSELEQETLTC